MCNVLQHCTFSIDNHGSLTFLHIFISSPYVDSHTRFVKLVSFCTFKMCVRFNIFCRAIARIEIHKVYVEYACDSECAQCTPVTMSNENAWYKKVSAGYVRAIFFHLFWYSPAAIRANILAFLVCLFIPKIV